MNNLCTQRVVHKQIGVEAVTGGQQSRPWSAPGGDVCAMWGRFRAKMSWHGTCCYVSPGDRSMNTSLEGNLPDSMETLIVECSEPRETAVMAELGSGVENELLSFRAAIAKWANEYARHCEEDRARDPSAAAADLRRWSREHFQATQARSRGVSAPAERRPAPVDVRAA